MKPKRCPLAEWEFDENSEDKRTIQPETGKCFFPAVVIESGCPDNIYTPGMFKCPETHIDGGDYTKCDLFSRWWWEQKMHSASTRGRNKKDKKNYEKQQYKKIKERAIENKTKDDIRIIVSERQETPEIGISKGDLPLFSPNEIDSKSSKVAKNWKKFKLK